MQRYLPDADDLERIFSGYFKTNPDSDQPTSNAEGLTLDKGTTYLPLSNSKGLLAVYRRGKKPGAGWRNVPLDQVPYRVMKELDKII